MRGRLRLEHKWSPAVYLQEREGGREGEGGGEESMPNESWSPLKGTREA